MAQPINLPFDFEVISPNVRNVLGEFVTRPRDGHAFCITNSHTLFHRELHSPVFPEDCYHRIMNARYDVRFTIVDGAPVHHAQGLTLVELFTYGNADYYITKDTLFFSQSGRIYDTQTLELVGCFENGEVVLI